MLNTQTILLHPLTQVSDEWLYEIFSNKDLLQYTDAPIIDVVSDVLIITNYLSEKNKQTWVITKQDTQEDIGFITAVIAHKHKTASLTFVLLPQYQKQGYMREALSKCISLLFCVYSIIRIEAQVYINNISSIHLLESLGFTKEGTLRKNFMINGLLEDSYIYSLIMNVE